MCINANMIYKCYLINMITFQNLLLMTITTTQINQLSTATEHVLIW